MKLDNILQAAGVIALVAAAGTASATTVTVSVSAFSGPWDPTIAGNPAYGVGDNSPATVIPVAPNATVGITYLSGLTSAFSGAGATQDANGYTYLSFGSGVGFTGVGSSGTYFPSHAIDPTNSGSPIYLSELIGDFVNSSGVVLAAFAVGDGPFSIAAPAGTAALQLGVNDDIYSDNSGALNVQVSGVSAVPLPAALPMFGAAIAGLAGWSVRKKIAS